MPALAGTPTVWNGPRITFTKTALANPALAANQDRITPNVWITRGSSQGIYNAKTESSFTHNFSPADTEWANGTTANYNSLSYTDWNSWAKGVNAGPPSTVGVDAVVHLKTDNIYIDVKFTSWSSSGTGGGFSYSRSTPSAANNPPSVSITNPVSGATFIAPTNVTIQATASDSDGSVTNVQFFDGPTSLGNAAASPYHITTSLGLGSHTLTAVASDNLGATTTSAPPVTVSVIANSVPPSPVQIAVNPSFQSGFNFSFLTQTGYLYTVEFTTNLGLPNWFALTNFTGNGSVANVTDSTATNLSRAYRVGAR